MTNAYSPSPIGGQISTTGYMAPAPLPARPVTPTPPTYAPSYNGSFSPAQIHSALISAGASPAVATTLTAVSGAESNFGKSPLSPPNHDGSRDHGVFQVNDRAWPQYPNVASRPLQDQAAIALHIYNTQGPGAWSTYNNGAYKKFLGQVGSNTAPAGAPGAPSAPSAPADASVGAALAALNGPGSNVDLKPALNDLNKIANPDQTQMAHPDSSGMQLQQAAAAGGNARQQQLAMLGAQQAAMLRQQTAQPLSWSTRPYGSTAGPQIPGTTLTSPGVTNG